ncbi:hypothetical protein HID58_074677 [Brassica napus]|uniref:Uncharacterized protein n=1 Tax=Brassica napus TaxID=3708 RepID=A0ABQ7YHJ5_BRANA|nr:hypothetical protein HID58_074677 [Brassica napus]
MQGSMKARHKVIAALIITYLWVQIAILHGLEWPRINGRVQLMVPPSLFGMGTTAHHKKHVKEFYSDTKNQLGYNPKTTQEATAITSKPQGASRDRCEDLNESPLQLLQAQEAQARPAESSMWILSFGLRVSPLQLLQAQEAQERPGESSMRILSFGLWVLLNLLIPLILSLAKILPLRIPGSSTGIWGMSGSITLYADVPGFSIKLLANFDQSPPWGQHLILIMEKK